MQWPKFGCPEDHEVTEAIFSNVRFHYHTCGHPAPPAPKHVKFQGALPLLPFFPTTQNPSGPQGGRDLGTCPFIPAFILYSPDFSTTIFESALGFMTERVPLLRNKGLVLSSFTHKRPRLEKSAHPALHVIFSVVVCSFQFRTYPIIYLLSGGLGTGDSSFRKCFCAPRPKANPGADGSPAKGVHVHRRGSGWEGEVAWQNNPSVKFIYKATSNPFACI